ncbi:MAG TPA: YraN family protein [Bacteroidota bacterium]|jgi:putative endonuclease
MDRPSTKQTGDLGEVLATKFLRELGMEIIETNYRFERGEIDIIGREGDVLVFVEVKLRFNDAFGEAEYAVTLRKQRQLKRVAEGYYHEHELRNQECRFDVVAIMMHDRKPEIRYYKNAFY